MKLYDKPFDLVECGRRHPKRIAIKPFASHIVSLADDVIRPHIQSGELEGIRTCIRHLLKRLEWKHGIGLIPLLTRRYRDGSFENEGNKYILVDSVIFTTLNYRAFLDEDATGLRAIILGEFVQGLEWACYAANYTSKFDDQSSFPILEPDVFSYVSEVHV